MARSNFTAGGDIKGAFAIGRKSTATATITETVAPDPNIDIAAALSALRSILSAVPEIETKALTRIDEAKEEATKPTPKREEVKSLVAQAASYAREASGFVVAADKLRPHLQSIAAWLGSTWESWAPSLGL